MLQHIDPTIGNRTVRKRQGEGESELEQLIQKADQILDLEFALENATTCNTDKVTPGEFGLALQAYTNTNCVPNQVVLLLRLSPTFIKMAGKLDDKYLRRGRWREDWKLNADGQLIAGPYTGRWLLEVRYSPFGSRFVPYSSVDADLGWDVIWVEQPDSSATRATEIGLYLERIAHETTHAFLRVTRRGPPQAAMADRIRDAVNEEVYTRNNELKIVQEIQKKAGTSWRGFTPSAKARTRAGVERDFFPSDPRRTYLENFVLSELINRAIQDEKLDKVAINAKDHEIASLSIPEMMATFLGRLALQYYVKYPNKIVFYEPKRKTFVPIKPEYSRLRFLQRVMDARWRLFLAQNSPRDPNFDAAKERVLQEHARAFFRGVVTYSSP
jgi:hypothetical protein